jgi:CRP/FNR family transcriptional regulator, cyclic AMP receptor protein
MSTLTVQENHTITTHKWFSSLPAELQQDMLAHAQVKRYADGQPIYRRGEQAHSWYAVAAGAVRASGISATGKEVTLTYIEPGVWFGEISLFDKLPRTHDGTAHGDTTLLLIPAPSFHDLCDKHPALLRGIIQLQCHRIRLLFAALEDTNTLPLPQRLARQLQALANAYGNTSTQGVRIELQLAQEELAQLLGASRQRVNAEMKALERAQIIEHRQGKVTILNPQALSTWRSDEA